MEINCARLRDLVHPFDFALALDQPGKSRQTIYYGHFEGLASATLPRNRESRPDFGVHHPRARMIRFLNAYDTLQNRAHARFLQISVHPLRFIDAGLRLRCIRHILRLALVRSTPFRRLLRDCLVPGSTMYCAGR